MGLRLLSVAFFIGGAFAGSILRDPIAKCSTECHPPQNPKFVWQIGKTYVFSYKSENSMVYTGKEKQTTSIEGKVEFQGIDRCNVFLRMKDISINEKMSDEEMEDFKEKLKIPVVISHNDHELKNICPSPEESTQSLNIKRAMISSFINTMSRLDVPQEVEEYDTLGKCHTKYTVEKGDDLVIKKEKDLKTCTNRHTFITDFLKKKFPTSLLFTKEYVECEQYIEGKIMKKMVCKEVEKMKFPLKNQNGSIELSGILEMELIEINTAKSFQHQITSREELQLNLEDSRPGDSSEKKVRHILQDLCLKNRYVVDIDVNSDFMKLVSQTKVLSYEELKRIYESLKNKKLCSSKKVKDLFVDTLSVIGTDAGVKLIAKLIENHDVTGLKAKLLPASFALVPKPTQNTVAAVADLVKYHPSASVILGVTAMIHRLCSSEDCDKISSVAKVVAAFDEYLGSKCSSGDEKKILTALKAFGNMGYHGKAQRNIIECAKSCSKSTKVRLAAIESFRRIDKKIPDEFLDIYSNTSEDYEVRISIFASMVKHADEQQLQQIAEVAENETDEQVSSYVYTFLKNIGKTPFPSKQKMRKMLQILKIEQPKENYWENSKHIEVSGFNKLMVIGGAIETDIIQDPHTKLPRSVHTHLNIDLFDKNFNLLEFGVRAENLEDMINKFIELQQSLSKKKRQSLIGMKNLLGDSYTEFSLFVRAMNTEIFDLSTSDLSALKEVVNISEMAHQKDFDLSHSFVFMNSKLILPSITGRSYSIDLTGSSTVGLTAKSKFDLLSLPEAGDVQIQFQPSMNVEISTSVGIQSNYHKPGIKITSRLHLESGLGASFQVQDGQAVLASLTLPSDDILAVKISTEMLRIDGHNKAKPVFDKMQKKIDHCFRHLEKPFGISACARVEVPKPLVVRTFPYVLPFGNAEFALKKSDIFRSYEMRLEIPKNLGEIWKYKASLDTPGSRVKRQFVGEFQVIQRKGYQKFVIELASPFKTIGGSGSYVRSENLHQGALEFHTDSMQVFSSNFTNKLMSSRGRKAYETSTSVSYMGNSPTHIDGTITITKGRKYHLSFDFKTNKPISRPVRLKGSFTKEGRPTLSLKSEWKLSSDISLSSPFGDAHLSQAISKVSKQVQGISGNIKIDYQIMGMEKQVITLLGTSQKTSGKINSNAKFQMTQYPDANWHLDWNMQRQSTENMKNDIMLKYGRHSEKNYVQLKQNSTIAKSGHGLSTAFLEISSLNMSYKAIIKHYLDFSVSPKIHVEADICYEDNKHIKGLVDVKYESKLPLKINGKFEVEYPGGHYIYEETITQTSVNSTEGKAKFQYKEGKVIELTYKIQTLSNNSALHYEIGSSFQTPSSPNPIKHKASLQLNRDHLILAGDFSSKYSLEANFKKEGTALISLKSSKLEGKVEAINEIYKKSISMDLKLNSRRHVKALAIAEYGVKKRFHLEIVPSVENEPDKKILISSDIDIVQINNSRNASHLVSSNQGDIFSLNPHDTHISYNRRQEFHLMSSIKNFAPISLSYRAELEEGLPKFSLNFSRNLVEKAKIELGGSVLQDDRRQEFSFKTLALSPDNSFENLALTLNHKISRSNSSTSMESLISFKKKAKLYEAEWNSDLHPHKLEMKAKMQTPHVNFKKQAIGISFKQYNNGISSSVHIETPDDKLVTLVTDLQKNTDGYSVACTLNSPFDIVRDVQAQLTIEPHPNETEIEAYIDVNNARLSELRSSISLLSEETNLEGSFRLMRVPNIDFEGLHIQYKHSKAFMSVSGKIDLIDCRDITFNSEIKDESGIKSATATITTPYENLKEANVHIAIKHQSSHNILLLYIDANGNRIIDAEIKIILSSLSTEFQSRLKIIHIPEKLIFFKSDSMNESSSLSIKVWNQTSATTNGFSNNHKVLEEAKDHENILLDFKISKEVSENNLKTYGLKASGAFPFTSVTFSTNRDERSTLSSELRVCQETQQIKCYSIIAYDKNLKNSGNYNFYRKFSIDLKSFVGGSFEESIGSFNLLSRVDKYDFRSNMIFHMKGKAVGYDITVHKRRHESDHHTFDGKFYYPLKNCRLVGSILHNSNRTLLETEFSREGDQPGRLFLIATGREINHITKEMSGFIKMANPNMSEPLLIRSEFQRVGSSSVRSKLMIRHNATRTNTLIAEIIPNSEHKPAVSDSGRPNRKTLLFKLYTEDKALDASFMLTKQRSKLEDKDSYEWDFNLGDIRRKGAIVTTLSKKSKNARIAYFVPTTDLEVSRKMAEDSGDASLSLISHEKKIREIYIQTSGSCLNIEVLSSEPFIKSSLCFNKRSGNLLQLIKCDIYHRSRKCLEVGIGLDLRNPTFMNGNLKWKQKDLCRAVKELSGLSSMINKCSLAEIKEELKGNFEFYKKDVLGPALKKFWKKGAHYAQDKYEVFKNEVSFQSAVLDQEIKAATNRTSFFIRSLKDLKFTEQILLPIIQAFRCSLQKNVQELLKYLPLILGRIFRSIASRLQYCLEKFCIRGTLCYKFIPTEHGLKNIKNILFRKLVGAKKSLEMKISKIYVAEVVNRIKSDIATFMQEIGSSTSHSIELISRIGKFVEKMIPQKTVNTTGQMIKKIYDRLSQDEDFITAKDLVLEAFKQLKKEWRDKLLQIQNIIKENPEKMLQKQFQILKYNPKDGELDFRIRQPLKREEIENLEKEIQNVIDQLQGSLDF
ncbi:unnamed protein product [Larinioides sclopetarius]|uniref:Vitellogenin domain-containing protein n=1 Tax=Larinioides sclopetarius TaxID=280406 RepID=A0AAV1ZH38_9ARAC